jgi:hypothetical protein
LPEGVPYIERGEGGAVILPETPCQEDADHGFYIPDLDLNDVLVLGDSYILTLNGTDYGCVLRNGAEVGAPENVAVFVAGAPIAVYDPTGKSLVVRGDGLSDITVSITSAGSSIPHPLDERLLPEGVSRLYDVVFTISGNTATMENDVNEVFQKVNDPNFIVRGIWQQGLDKGVLNISEVLEDAVIFGSLDGYYNTRTIELYRRGIIIYKKKKVATMDDVTSAITGAMGASY